MDDDSIINVLHDASRVLNDHDHKDMWNPTSYQGVGLDRRYCIHRKWIGPHTIRRREKKGSSGS